MIGSINIYTSDERTFNDVEIGFVKVVAGQAAIAIQNARLMSQTLEMKRVLEARKLIDRAKGILQYKHRFTEEEAYLRLRNQSRKLGRSMRDLAEAVILADDLNRLNEPGDTLIVREAEEDSWKPPRRGPAALPLVPEQDPTAAAASPRGERH